MKKLICVLAVMMSTSLQAAEPSKSYSESASETAAELRLKVLEALKTKKEVLESKQLKDEVKALKEENKKLKADNALLHKRIESIMAADEDALQSKIDDLLSEPNVKVYKCTKE